MRNEIIKAAGIRIGHLEKLAVFLEKRISSSPDGRVRIANHHGKSTYYYVSDSSNNGRYMNAGDLPFVQKLVQKAYDEKVLKSAKNELELLRSLVDNYPDVIPENVINGISEARRQLVRPVNKSDEAFITEWESIPYKQKGFKDGDPVILTNRGERVRSKSEKIIADRLFERGVPYKYECPLKLSFIGVIHPDFTVLNVSKRREEYIEHNGMMDMEDCMDNFICRINNYEIDGIRVGDRLHLMFETDRVPIDPRILDLIIDDLLGV